MKIEELNPKTRQSGETQSVNKPLEVTKEFADSTGIHGIGHIGKRTKLNGTAWIIICLAGLCKDVLLFISIYLTIYSFCQLILINT